MSKIKEPKERLHGLGRVGDYSATLPSSPESSGAEDDMAKVGERLLTPGEAKAFFEKQLKSRQNSSTKISKNSKGYADESDDFRDSLLDAPSSSSSKTNGSRPSASKAKSKADNNDK